MYQYTNLIARILNDGVASLDRTGVGTLRVAGHMMRFDLNEGLPVITTKKIHLKSVIHELLWMLSGNTNIKYLNDHDVHIWDEWADSDGDLGPIYGHQWRAMYDWPENRIDQVQNALDMLHDKPDDRGIIVNSWSVPDLPYMALRPCHCLFQLIHIDGKLNLEIYQRSADVFIGLPFNITFYALLTHMFAQQANMDVGELIWVGGDVHLYCNHIKQAREQILREPRVLPTLVLNNPGSMFNYKYRDFQIVGYDPHPAIRAEVAV